MKKQLLGWLLLALPGCAPVVYSGGLDVYADHWAQTTQQLEYHAEADLGPCSERQFVLLEREKRYPVRVGVRGCGVTAVYEKRRRGRVTRAKGARWELATRSAPPVPQVELDYPAF